MKKVIARKKMKKVLTEFAGGMLHSGSKKGPVVKKKSQALAIGMSEGRKAKAKIIRARGIK